MTIPSRSYLLKNIIESGVDIDKSSYDDLCHYMLDSDGIIQAIELAPTVWSSRSIRWLTTSRPSASTLSMTRSAAKTPPWPKTEAGRPSTCLSNLPPGEYDAILMDVMMPNVDGLTTARIIRALDRPDVETVPILALTANAFAEDARKCLDADMNAHLAKPLNMPLVKATIAKFTQH